MKPEKRKCERFVIPGATLNYKKKRLLFNKETDDEEICPVLNMSLGGLSFLSQKSIDPGSAVTIKLFLPDKEEKPIVIRGKVNRSSLSFGKSYRFMHGVFFAPYGEKKNHNEVSLLEKLKTLEETFKSKTQHEQ
ncbi:MAG: PilZ domain-containing protein [Proteobacteria bacterium]|nr:PilZ domain-containing protein [Pseudomonadota bacterium]